MEKISPEEPLILAGRRFSRLKSQQPKSEYKSPGFGYVSVLIIAAFVAFSYWLALLAKRAAESGDFGQINYIAGCFPIAILAICFGAAPIAMRTEARNRKKNPLEPKNILETGTAEVAVVCKTGEFHSVRTIGVLSLREGLLCLEGTNFNFAIDRDSFKNYSRRRPELQFIIKHPKPTYSQTVTVYFRRLPVNIKPSSFIKELMLQWDTHRGETALGLYPPIEVYPCPFNRPAMIRGAIGGFVGGILISLFIRILPKVQSLPVTPWMDVLMGVVIGLSCVIMLTLDPMIAKSSKKTLAKWIAKEHQNLGP